MYERYYAQVESGRKTIEVRVHTPRMTDVAVGDVLVFHGEESGRELDVRAKRITPYTSFAELLAAEDISRIAPDAARVEQLINLRRLYPPEKESLGMLAIMRSGHWRWWSYEPMRIDWLSTFVLFAGTLVFGINLLDSFLHGLTAQQSNRLIWAPDMVGCLLFLISGHLALVEVSHGRPRIRAHDLGWWIVAVNQVGSVLFMVAALADFTLPGTGSLVNAGIANWGTLLGALCFALGGVLQAFERP
ncbi:ASCH domain-containing protein [Streptomyces sp. NPDC005180]|uniref:ASCH domain-containing protein n=1 Tax=Streptomyces sp. NPDC005180 TaxID=3156868 RepID=UPI0033B0A74F